MFKKTLLALIATTFLATQTTDSSLSIEIEEPLKGISVYHLIDQANGCIIGSLTVSEGQLIEELGEIAEIYGDEMPADLVSTLTEISTVYKTVSFADQTIFFVGDLYIAPEYREHGYAQFLMNQVCTSLTTDDARCLLVVVPDPFELDENRTVKSLKDEVTYSDKKAKLVRLYEKCGFTKHTTHGIVFMTYNYNEKNA